MLERTKRIFTSRRAQRVTALGLGLCAAALVGAVLLRRGAAVGCTGDDLSDTRALMLLREQWSDAQPSDSAPAKQDAQPEGGAQNKDGVQGGSAAQDGDGAQTADKVVYLTFDDGPSRTTESVLDTLKAEGVPATFFVMAAENNEKYLPILERTAAEGHLIALHTCSHEYKEIYRSADAYWNDLSTLREKLLPYVPAEQEIRWIRFPGGSSNTVSHRYGGRGIMKQLIAEAEERGFTYIDWNISAEDAVGGHPSAGSIYNNIVRGVGDKDVCIVLMHDTNATKNTAAALPDVIRWFKNAGYRFDTVDHLKEHP